MIIPGCSDGGAGHASDAQSLHIEGKRVPSDGRIEIWAFASDNDVSPAGRLTLFNFNSRNRSAEFGYVVEPALRGRGVGRCMLQTAFDQFFTQRDLNKLHCRTASFNTPSVRLLEGLGLMRDGVLRAEHELEGSLYDDYIYSLLREEWLAGHGRSIPFPAIGRA